MLRCQRRLFAFFRHQDHRSREAVLSKLDGSLLPICEQQSYASASEGGGRRDSRDRSSRDSRGRGSGDGPGSSYGRGRDSALERRRPGELGPSLADGRHNERVAFRGSSSGGSSSGSLGRVSASPATAAALPLALQNAPRQVHELLGDPRTGVADDVTSSGAFGELTVDMIHHQISNEVYWYKYEFAGGVLKETHRDARLTDYSKTLMYLLRAKDPQRWSIPALAEKFAVRKERVLTILALKELEAQRIESGRLLRGPLRAYGVPVHLADVALHPAEAAAQAGHPVAYTEQTLPLGAQAGPGGAFSSSRPGAAVSSDEASAPPPWHLGRALPDVINTAEQAQLAFLEALQPYNFSADELRAAVLSQLDEAEEFYIEHFSSAGGTGGTAGSSSGSSNEAGQTGSDATVSSSTASADGQGADTAAATAATATVTDGDVIDFAQYRRRVEDLIKAMAPFLRSNFLTLEHEACALEVEVGQALRGALSAHPDEVADLIRPGSASSFIIASQPLPAGLAAEPALSEAMGQVRLKLLTLLVQSPIEVQSQAPPNADVNSLSSQKRRKSASAVRARLMERVLRGLPDLRLRKLLMALLVPTVDALKAQGVDVYTLANYTTPASRAAAGDTLPRDEWPPSPPAAASDGGLDEFDVTASDAGGHSDEEHEDDPEQAALQRRDASAVAAHQDGGGATADGSAAGAGSGAAGDELEMPFDIWNFRKIPGAVFRRVAAALDALDSTMAELADQLLSLGASGSPSAPPTFGGSDVRALRELLGTYRSAEMMASKTEARIARNSFAPPALLSPSDKEQLQRILVEMGPDAVDRAERYIKLAEVRGTGERKELAELLAEAEDQQLLTDLKASAVRRGRDAASVTSASKGSTTVSAKGKKLISPEPYGKVNWDLFAAYMDKVAGRKYHRGSGERQLVRLSTFPAFEGYSLQEFDQLAEGELSQMNRRVAELQEGEMYRRFRESLLYNLGLRGEGLRGPQKGRPKPNLRTLVDCPLVVYDVGADGATRYPPLYVALASGAQRPLNEQELVHQERRIPKPRLAYHTRRIQRLPELE